MGNLTKTYQHIADILSFTSSRSKLENTLTKSSFDWDAIVIEGSKHLVLPAIFCRLKTKNLLKELPTDLENYLEEITAINRNRNKAILNQIYSISQLFKNNKIDHVFLKGSALLAHDCYQDFAERMIGDIDILISNQQLNIANDILITNGYYPIKQTFGYKYFGHKHLPRLKTDKFICAVELHSKLFTKYRDEKFANSYILKKKQLINNVYIPSTEHLTKHNILNFQINDKGNVYHSINFRSAYDTLLLHSLGKSKSDNYKNKIYQDYYNIIGLFFDDLNKTIHTKKTFKTEFYLFKLKYSSFYFIWNKILNLLSFLSILLNRIPFFITNKAYRKDIIDDRQRIFLYFKSKNDIP